MPAKYNLLNENKEWESVTGEMWRWKAQYENGFVFYQFNDDTGRFHRFDEIDQSRLVRFTMYSPSYPHTFTFDFPQGAKLVHKYLKGRVVVNLEDNQEYIHNYQFYVFGYDKHILTIDKKGNLFIGDDTRRYAEEEAQKYALAKIRQTR